VNFLTRKLGPFPVWAYAIFAGAVVFVLIRSRSSSSASSTVQDGTAQPDLSANDTSSTGDDSQQAVSGVSPDLLDALLGPNSALAQALAAVYSGQGVETTGTGSSTTTIPNPAFQVGSASGAQMTLPLGAPATGFSTATSQTGLGPGSVDVGGGAGSTAPGASISTPVAYSGTQPSSAPLGHGAVLTG
jgi:hypothetical protein